jgi:hypothetical protein
MAMIDLIGSQNGPAATSKDLCWILEQHFTGLFCFKVCYLIAERV